MCVLPAKRVKLCWNVDKNESRGPVFCHVKYEVNLICYSNVYSGHTHTHAHTHAHIRTHTHSLPYMLHTISLSLFLWHLAGTHIVSVTGLVDSQHCTGLSVVNISNRRKRREEREKKKREREREAKYTIIWSNAHLVNYTFLHSSTLKKLQKTAVFRHCSNCSLLPRQHDRDTGLLS